MKPWRVRTLMILVLLVAIDLGLYHTMTTSGSPRALIIFLVMNVLVPVVAGLLLAIGWFWKNHSSTTLY